MKLFCVGPVEMSEDIMAIASKKLPYFRTQEFSDLVLETQQILKNIIGTSQSSNVAILTSSGTGAMEAAIINAFNLHDKLLVINGGSFGNRFAKICDIHRIPYETLQLEFGEALKIDHLEKYNNRGFTAMLVNLHETSTGQLYDLEILSRFCKDNNMYLVVDAISSFLADPYSMDKSGVDLTIISSQKGLALHPGLSLIIANTRIYEEKIKRNNPNTLYFRLVDYFSDIKRGQTPYTPAEGILYQLHKKLKQIEEQGINTYVEKTEKIAKDFRYRVRELPFLIPSYPLSNALTPVLVEKKNAYDIFLKLKNQFDIFVTPSGGELKDKLLRIGHIGELKIDDNKLLIEALRKVV